MRGSANSWPGLDVYNERQGKEFPLLFHCVCVIGVLYSEHQAQLLPAPPPHTNVVLVRPLARDPRVLIGWPFPLGFGLDGRLLLARRGRVYV